MQRLEDRVAVITGAGSGIGGLREGECVPVHAAALRAAMEQLARDVIAAHGRCHILVNNAGGAVDGTIEEVSLDDFAWIVGINFRGVVHGWPSAAASA
jgi:NAD(P)-dependent dehydrogenase (short-subunit alcohol dehydrogenase family)